RVPHLVDEDQQDEAGREGPTPLEGIGADGQQHRRERLPLEGAREQADELGLAEDEEKTATDGAGGDVAADARACRRRRGPGPRALPGPQALVDRAQVLELARAAALGVVGHAARSSLGGRGITHASYTTMARNTSFIIPKFTARTR